MGPFDDVVLGGYRVRLAPGLTSSWIISYETTDVILFWSSRHDALSLGVMDVDIWVTMPYGAKDFRTRDEALLVLSDVMSRCDKNRKAYSHLPVEPLASIHMA